MNPFIGRRSSGAITSQKFNGERAWRIMQGNDFQKAVDGVPK